VLYFLQFELHKLRENLFASVNPALSQLSFFLTKLIKIGVAITFVEVSFHAFSVLHSFGWFGKILLFLQFYSVTDRGSPSSVDHLLTLAVLVVDLSSTITVWQ
jgi:hypothetical protein